MKEQNKKQKRAGKKFKGEKNLCMKAYIIMVISKWEIRWNSGWGPFNEEEGGGQHTLMCQQNDCPISESSSGYY